MGNVITNSLIAFFAPVMVEHCLMQFSAAFQTRVASFINVILLRTVTPYLFNTI